MRGRTGLVKPPRSVIEPLVVLVALVIFELVLLAIGLVLVDSGWKPAYTPGLVPAPMVSDVQLPDVAGDGS